MGRIRGPGDDNQTTILKAGKLAQMRAAAGRSACFVVIGGNQAGKLYKLDRHEMRIGRGRDVELRFDDDGVSRLHAKIVKEEGEVYLEDLGSTNGTFCNNDPVTRCVLQDGDKIQIGTTTILKFSMQDAVEEDFQRKQYESATRDGLTGCYNKKYFLERLPSEFAFAKRHEKPLSLAMFDIDYFKRVNDTHGHVVGDRVLQSVAECMLESVRSDDVLARFGGEEFAMLMREAGADEAFVAVERIRRRIEAMRIPIQTVDIRVSVSVGIATFMQQWEQPEQLLQAADDYLYKAKSAGRNRTESERTQ